MGGLSDAMLSASAAPLLENIHAETIKVLTGADAGKTFLGILEHEPDIQLETSLIVDPRAKRVLRFRNVPGNVPNLKKLDRLQTEDGKTYTATVRPGAAYLFVDFELAEVAKGIDT
jgi:hypothetical protein